MREQGLPQQPRKDGEAEQLAAAARPAEPIYVRPPHITAAARKPWEI